MGGKTQAGIRQATMNMSVDMEQCIQDCTDCHAMCISTTTHCLQLGGRYADHALIRLMLDCAEVCRVSADFMLRGSQFHDRTCALCAEVCERCAQGCDKFADDEHMRACAEACRHCANRCRSMASA